MRSGLLSLLTIALAAACGTDTPTAVPHAGHMDDPDLLAAEVNMDLAAIRRATARFHRIEAAEAAGYAQATGDAAVCIGTSDPEIGDMGFHWDHLVDPGLPNFDEVVDVTQPEALVYMPGPNGKLQLVAVEYLIPFSSVPEDGDPPTLMGQAFTSFAPAFPLWGLHAWVWKENPSGMFANFNPRLSCPEE